MLNVTAQVRAIGGIATWAAAMARLRATALQPRSLSVALAVAAVLSCASYVWLASGSAGINLEVRELRSQATALQQRSAELKQRATQLRSLSRVSEASARLGLEPLPSAEFAGVGSAVAAR